MGGEGSGRKVDPVKRLVGYNGLPMSSNGSEIIIPNYSGVKKHLNEGHNITTDDLTEGGTNLYFSGKDTDDLTEGSVNLYDKNVALTEGANITITGTYPNFTIASTASGGSSGAGYWTQSGANLYYTSGAVGIGDRQENPTHTLSVSGGATACRVWGDLDIVSGQFGLVIGGDLTGYQRTNNQIKVARILGAPYTNGATPITFMLTQCGLSYASLYIGGGSGFSYAATTIRFMTAANPTTPSGTERMRISSNGSITLGLPAAAPTGAKVGISGGALYISNSAAPTAYAHGGLIFISGGALYFTGSGGTITKIANA